MTAGNEESKVGVAVMDDVTVGLTVVSDDVKLQAAMKRNNINAMENFFIIFAQFYFLFLPF